MVELLPYMTSIVTKVRGSNSSVPHLLRNDKHLLTEYRVTFARITATFRLCRQVSTRDSFEKTDLASLHVRDGRKWVRAVHHNHPRETQNVSKQQGFNSFTKWYNVYREMLHRQRCFVLEKGTCTTHHERAFGFEQKHENKAFDTTIALPVIIQQCLMKALEKKHTLTQFPKTIIITYLVILKYIRVLTVGQEQG